MSLVSLATLLSSGVPAYGLGFALPDQDAFATARANAFVATADDPAAVYYNPAGISQLEGNHISIGAYGIEYQSTYKYAGGSINSKSEWAALPQVFSTISIPKYKLTLGLGTYSPYGLRYEWPAGAPFTAVGETAEMQFMTLNPVVAYKILPTLSVAAGATLNYSIVDFKENVTPPFAAPPGFVNHFRGRDESAGFNAGVLWNPLQEHSFGLTYRSATDMNYHGHATALIAPSVNIPSQANIHFPQQVALGYSYRPTKDWNLEVDGTWSDWSTLRNVYINPQGAVDKLPFNWHPSWLFGFGATRYLGDGWRLSAGYMYSMNSVPDADFSALVPDSDRHLFSIGVGKQYKNFSWDVAYQLGWSPSRTVSSDYFPPTDGSYDFLSHAISVNFGYNF